MSPASPAKADTPASTAYNLNRAEVIDASFVRYVENWRGADHVAAPPDPRHPIIPGCALTRQDVVELFESQMAARHQDIEARNMRARNEGFYTIGSAGHEGNAVLGRITRHTDIAFLHYRSGAFMAERSRKVAGQDFVRDAMLSFAASSLDPIAGGRHKVWGSAALWTPPQTSTIASHLPKSVGTAFFLKRARRLGLQPDLPADAIVLCSFGDGSLNHAAAQTALNAAGWARYQGLEMPILFVCEDNGLSISVPTPDDWIEASVSRRAGLKYFAADGLDILNAYAVSESAVEFARAARTPAFLHMNVVRLMGHAGTDAEHGYRSWEEIEATEALDPLLRTADLVLRTGAMKPAETLEMYERTRERVRNAAREAAAAPRLKNAGEVMAPLAPYHPDSVAREVKRRAPRVRGTRASGSDKPHAAKHMAALITDCLRELMETYPEMILFGEDVGKKGGVYGITRGLQAAFGAGRVFDTLLDETTILGLAIGAGQLGLLPVPEIQYLAYYHNAEDQIRGEACSTQYFSRGQFRSPMILRVQGWSYQKGFGGHFHNDNSIAAMRDVPGLVIATPARGDDAVKMLRTLAALAMTDGRVCIFLEPIALYMTRDLHTEKDGAWQFPYPATGEAIPLGEGAVYGDTAKDLTIITFGNGLYVSLRAAKRLREKNGIGARVVDLRWLNPLNEDLIVREALATGRVLVVDESRRTGGIAEAILAVLCERAGASVTARRLNALDTYVPLGPAADTVLPSEEDIVAAAREMTQARHRRS